MYLSISQQHSIVVPNNYLIMQYYYFVSKLTEMSSGSFVIFGESPSDATLLRFIYLRLAKVWQKVLVKSFDVLV